MRRQKDDRRLSVKQLIHGILQSAVEMNGVSKDSVQIDHKSMIDNIPMHFSLSGTPFALVKTSDGKLELYVKDDET